MSVAHLAAVFDLDEPTGATRAVLLVLAEHANAATGECWPSEARIARRAGIHPVTARKAVARLEADGFIAVERRPGRVNRYLLLLDVVRPVNPERQAPGRSRRPRATDSETPSERRPLPEPYAPRTVKNRQEPETVAAGLDAVRSALNGRTAS